MKSYRVSFYYGTDLREQSIVDAHDEVTAFILALHEIGRRGWVTEAGFRTEITIRAGY